MLLDFNLSFILKKKKNPFQKPNFPLVRNSDNLLRSSTLASVVNPQQGFHGRVLKNEYKPKKRAGISGLVASLTHNECCITRLLDDSSSNWGGCPRFSGTLLLGNQASCVWRPFSCYITSNYHPEPLDFIHI